MEAEEAKRILLYFLEQHQDARGLVEEKIEVLKARHDAWMKRREHSARPVACLCQVCLTKSPDGNLKWKFLHFSGSRCIITERAAREHFEKHGSQISQHSKQLGLLGSFLCQGVQDKPIACIPASMILEHMHQWLDSGACSLGSLEESEPMSQVDPEGGSQAQPQAGPQHVTQAESEHVTQAEPQHVTHAELQPGTQGIVAASHVDVSPAYEFLMARDRGEHIPEDLASTSLPWVDGACAHRPQPPRHGYDGSPAALRARSTCMKLYEVAAARKWNDTDINACLCLLKSEDVPFDEDTRKLLPVSTDDLRRSMADMLHAPTEYRYTACRTQRCNRLYRVEMKESEECLSCGTQRDDTYFVSYFSRIEHLKQIFASPHLSKEMRWVSEQRQTIPGMKLDAPDSELWRSKVSHADEEDPHFVVILSGSDGVRLVNSVCEGHCTCYGCHVLMWPLVQTHSF